MSPLFDVLLAAPLPVGMADALLFLGFALHLALALFALGTAFLAVFYCLRSCLGRGPSGRGWDDGILRTFMGFKSLAVVLGVAPLLLIQVRHTIPFFNAIGLFAALWMLIVVLLAASFVSFDALGHGLNRRPVLHAVVGSAALVLFVVVPGIFVAVIVAAENPSGWPAILRRGGGLPGPLGFHWLMRYLHVLAAAVVFGAVFHGIFTSRGDRERTASLWRWLVAGILAQVVIGPLLIVSLPLGMSRLSIAFLALGLLAVAALAWHAMRRGREQRSLDRKTSGFLLLGILVFMLLARQVHQDRAFAPLEASSAAASRERRAVLKPYEREALAGYRKDMEAAYDDGPAIYAGSCAFCHGEKGNGRGPAAGELAIPPEDIAQVRAARPMLLKTIASGVPGTGMPYFSVFIRTKLESLIDYLDKRWDTVGFPPPLTGIPAARLEQARRIYAQRCAACHGPDGRPTPAAAKFQPPPPDFAQFRLLPQRAIEVFTHGYPGTMMGPYGAGLPLDVREPLVQVLYGGDPI
jgi:mono/diheme cytochrome c family protein